MQYSHEGHNITIHGLYFHAPESNNARKSLYPCACLQFIQSVSIDASQDSEATVIVVHGHGVNIGKKIDPNLSVLEKAVFPYYQAGFNVLAIDLRNHGQSSYSPPVTLGLHESYDIQAAVTWLRGRGVTRIGIWAESMGAASTIFAARLDAEKAVRAVVLDSPFARFRDVLGTWVRVKIYQHTPDFVIDYLFRFLPWFAPFEISDLEPVRYVDQLTVPVLLTHGTADRLVNYSHFQEYERAIARQAKDLWTTHTHEHGHVAAWRDPAWTQTMVDFMETHV